MPRALTVKRGDRFTPFTNVKNEGTFVPFVMRDRLSFYVLFNDVESVTYETEFTNQDITNLSRVIRSEAISYASINTEQFNLFSTVSVTDPTKTTGQGFLNSVEHFNFFTGITQTFNQDVSESIDIFYNLSTNQVTQSLINY